MRLAQPVWSVCLVDRGHVPTLASGQQFTLSRRAWCRALEWGEHSADWPVYRAVNACQQACASPQDKGCTTMFRTAILALAATLSATTASAALVSSTSADVTLRLAGFAYGYAAVDTSANSGYVGAGEFTGTITRSGGQATSFLTYCTDIYQSFNWNTTYTYTQVDTGTANGFTARQEDLLGKLYTLAGAGVDSTDKSAAFQLAVWEIVTETGPALSLTSGSFYLDAGGSTAQRALASNWLAAVGDIHAAKSFNAARLYSSTTQDFVVFTGIPQILPRTSTSVPEPGSIALAGLALAALVGTRLRKR
jgi:hypothetical protein